ncbi:MAG: restriction endonuclease subunit S [Fibrobacteria bacterium]
MKPPAYSKYNPSGVEWLGEVPAHWRVKRLKYVSSINDDEISELTAPDYEIEYVDIGSVNQIAGITDTEKILFESAPSRARRRVKDGDTIVSTVRTYLKAIAAIESPPDNLVVSTGFTVVRPKQVLPGYLAHFLKSTYFVESIVSRSVGVSYPAINASELGEISLAIPEEEEQEIISSFLDSATAKLDSLMDKKRSLIEKLKEKRSALISLTVTKGLPPEVAEEYAAKFPGLDAKVLAKRKLKPSGIDWLGEVPEGWAFKKLKWIYSDIESGDGISPEEIDSGGSIPVYGGNGIMGYTEKHNSSTEDIIVGRVGAKCGNVYLVPGKKWISDNALKIDITHHDKKFFSLVLESRNLNQLANQNAQPLITGSIVGNQFVTVPSFPEQVAIVKYLEEETMKIDRMIEKVESALDKLSEYRTALITAAVTGKIDVRGFKP